MLSNQATPSLVHHYKQFPLNDEPFNKKVQKHIPQRIDVVGKSAEFTIKTGLLELLPDECMVGVECCYMRDATNPAAETYELGPIKSEYIWKTAFLPFCSQSYRYNPTISVQTVNDIIQVRNPILTNPNDGSIDDTIVVIQSKDYMPTSNLAQAFDVVTYTWQFMGWEGNTYQAGLVSYLPYPSVIYYLTDQDITQITGVDTSVAFHIGPEVDPPFVANFNITGAAYLPDSSLSLCIATDYIDNQIYVGSIVQFALGGTLFNWVVKEYDGYFNFKVTLDRQYVNDFGIDLTTLPFGPIRGAYVKNQIYISGLGLLDVMTATVLPGSVVKLYQLPDRTCTWELNDNIAFASPGLAPANKSFQVTYFSGSIVGNVRQYFQPTFVVPGSLSTTSSDITNINIESPLFTSARTYNTATNSYSQTIGSFPWNTNNTVTYKEAVNNRNCSMYQINKNILNNFEIPFRITVDDGSALYQVQNPDKFYIRFSLWFYEQTDDERYYYIPTM